MRLTMLAERPGIKEGILDGEFDAQLFLGVNDAPKRSPPLLVISFGASGLVRRQLELM